jgi:hypothetical protein
MAMYEGAEQELQRILKLVDLCPEPLKPKAFEILLQGFVNTHAPRAAPASATPVTTRLPAPPPAVGVDWSASVPTDVLPRLQAMAKRRSMAPEKLASLFDFSADPFSFAPLHVPGDSQKERTRRVALLVAARSFLATGRWVADWAEIKAMSTHQNCYNLPNFAATMKEGKGDIFKSVNSGTSVDLSASGTDAAEKLLVELAAPDAA